MSLLETCVGVGIAVKSEELFLDDGEDVLLADDEELLFVDLELGAGVLCVQDRVALLDVDRLALAVIERPARTDGQDGALLGLLLGGVGKDDPALCHLFTSGRLDHDAVAQWAKLRRGSGGCGPRAFLLGTAATADVDLMSGDEPDRHQPIATPALW